MSRSLRTIPAGALAACAVVLLTAPQTEAVAARTGRPDVTAPRPAAAARLHTPGAAGESPAPSGAPHAAAEGTQAAGGPGWPAPVAPPAEPLIDSEVWRPAGTAHDQALDGAPARAVGPHASPVGAPAPPVLTFGAGLTSLGLGIAFFALRLRRG